jgi:RNA polymerase sigma-70 factor (ECF subfamily)
MSETEPFAVVLARARQGDEAALTELARRYEPEVRLVARKRLSAALRPYLDSMDLVQSVHRSVLFGLRNQKFDLERPEQLVALALTIVRRKAARKWQRAQRQQRLSGQGWSSDTSLPDLFAALSSPDADPADTARYRDAVAQICTHLEDTDRQIMELLLLGYRTADAARELGLNPDVTRVKVSRLRQRLRAAGIGAEWL